MLQQFTISLSFFSNIIWFIYSVFDFKVGHHFVLFISASLICFGSRSIFFTGAFISICFSFSFFFGCSSHTNCRASKHTRKYIRFGFGIRSSGINKLTYNVLFCLSLRLNVSLFIFVISVGRFSKEELFRSHITVHTSQKQIQIHSIIELTSFLGCIVSFVFVIFDCWFSFSLLRSKRRMDGRVEVRSKRNHYLWTLTSI